MGGILTDCPFERDYTCKVARRVHRCVLRRTRPVIAGRSEGLQAEVLWIE